MVGLFKLKYSKLLYRTSGNWVHLCTKGKEVWFLYRLRTGTADIWLLILSLWLEHSENAFCISVCLQYLVAPTVKRAKHFTLVAFFTSSHLLCRRKCTSLPLSWSPNGLSSCWAARWKPLVLQGSGALRLRAANVFLNEHFQVLQGLAITLPNALVLGEPNISAPCSFLRLSIRQNWELPGAVWAADVFEDVCKITLCPFQN